VFGLLEIDVALIGASGAVVVAVTTGLFAWLTARQTRSAVGTPNGHGNVVEMAERILMELGRLHEKIDDQAEDFTEHVGADEQTFAQIAHRLERLEGYLMG
jgi:hypothetical protein